MDIVLSVGAGIEQIEGIKIARELGFQIIAVDKNENAEGFEFADIALNIDIRDEKSIIDIAKKYKIKSVLPSPIGRYLTTVGAVNDSLRLRGITKQGALNCVDKVLFNRILSENNIKCAKSNLHKIENLISQKHSWFIFTAKCQ